MLDYSYFQVNKTQTDLSGKPLSCKERGFDLLPFPDREGAGG